MNSLEEIHHNLENFDAYKEGKKFKEEYFKNNILLRVIYVFFDSVSNLDIVIIYLFTQRFEVSENIIFAFYTFIVLRMLFFIRRTFDTLKFLLQKTVFKE